MTSDLNKSITSISYNHLNLPTEISWTGSSNKIRYVYNAAGQKVKKTVVDGTTTKIVDYLDGFQTEARGSRIPVGAIATQLSNNEQYAGEVLQFFPHPEGYVKATPGAASINSPPTSYSYNYVYNYTDHLGNVRLSYSKNPATNQLNILEENHYYPFGLKHEVYISGGKRDYRAIPDDNDPRLIGVTQTDYQYKYNGKELQDELGLNMYDMDMRQYDPTIARWVVMDPIVHHSMSPYNSFDNNPVFWADPSGADAEGSDALGRRKFDDFGMYILPHQRGEAREVPQNKSKEKEEEGVLINMSKEKDNVIGFKPEEGMIVDGIDYLNNGSYALKPGETWIHGFDGVAMPHLSGNSIYKVSDGMNMIVTDTEVITWAANYKGVVGKLVESNYSLSNKIPGWKSIEWLNKLTSDYIYRINHNLDTGTRNIISKTANKKDLSWYNLYNFLRIKNLSEYKKPHNFYEVIETQKPQFLPKQ